MKISLELRQGLSQRMDQRMVLSPAMIQSINLLMLTRMELAQKIEQELVTNPVLEVLEPGEEEANLSADEKTDSSSESVEKAEVMEAESEAGEEEQSSLDDVDIDWEEYFQDSMIKSREARSQIDLSEEDLDFERISSDLPTFKEYILQQLRLLCEEDEEFKICEFLVSNLDEHGLFYNLNVEEAASFMDVSTEKVEKAIRLVQSLDPPGVGARSVTEGLEIQCRFLGIKDELLLAIIRDYFEDLGNNKIPQIARALNVSIADINQAASLIKSLNPKPALAYRGGEDTVYIMPDVFVEQLGDRYVVQINDVGIPRLRINSLYKRIVMNRRRGDKKEEYKYIKDKLDSARWLIRSINRRRDTLYRVASAIVEHQKDFLDKGIAYLHPLTLGELADEVGVHQATVGRVTTGKYMQTPRGLFELKYFFSGGLDADNGEMSVKSIKAFIKEIISSEEKKKPLSDKKIMALLNGKGIEVKRRTIQKYRDELGIPSSSKRRRY